MNLEPPTTTDPAALETVRRDFPRYRIDVELTVHRPCYVARRLEPGPGPHTLMGT